MTRINFYRNNTKDIYCFTVEGHSGYAESGSDIVCSAISVLVFNTINSIQKFTDDNIVFDIKEDGAYIKCTLPDIKTGKVSHDANLLLNAMAFGLEALKDEYGKYININEVKEV